ncbi:MAG: hypothetical protein JWP87_6424 [Labilithrix sp.]|nr:hypothetical protein [Labilithrix sp.]
MNASRTCLQLVVAATLCAACGSADDAQRTPAETAANVDGNAPAGGNTPATPPPAAGTTMPAPAAPSEYDVEKKWAEDHGVVIEPNKTTVIGKRRGNDARSDKYEDSLVVFEADGTLVRFVGTTKPAQMPSPGSAVVPDVDDDGRKDLGIVRPGIYRAHGSVTYGLPGYERNSFKVTTEDDESGLPAWRDLTGDGVFSPSEKMLSEQRKYTISGIYIHYGFAPAGTTLGVDTYIGPWSVGCQNVQYKELDAFVQAVGGKDATFRYAIIED